jgi:hypothetical protein
MDDAPRRQGQSSRQLCIEVDEIQLSARSQSTTETTLAAEQMSLPFHLYTSPWN